MEPCDDPLREVAYQIAGELRSMASVGLAHSDNPYDTDRYQRILADAARLAAAAEGRSDSAEPLPFKGDLSHVSPQVGCDAVVVSDGRVLLVQRTDNHLWCLPGGWVEVGETLAEATARELREEAGLTGIPLRVLGIFASRIWHSLMKAHMYHCIVEVSVEDPHPSPGFEALDAGFFSEGSLPPLTQGHISWLPVVFKLLRGEMSIPYFDLRRI
jgi:ADP-ribose pyrophosphatase YjhB (NUDIX family)